MLARANYIFDRGMSKKVLLLNSSYEPITFINDRKAISLLFREKAEALSYWKDYHLGMPNHRNLPSVMRLVNWYKKVFKTVKFSRKVVFCRDNWSCQFCGVKLLLKDATIDHIIPKSKGGKTDWYNCVTACRICNRKKSNKLLEKTTMKLLSTPKPPNAHHFSFIRRSLDEWHEEWSNYIDEY